MAGSLDRLGLDLMQHDSIDETLPGVADALAQRGILLRPRGQVYAAKGDDAE